MDDIVEPVSPVNHRLTKYLKQARDRLIQTGTRNRLIHTARFPKRGKSIDIITSARTMSSVFLSLIVKRMRFDHESAG
ncbi:MAG: hypothetical protein EOQ86_32445 [Mesorhizobium sp.]|uniref:hypothetical protein n=1 Tax=Mesorhizobium sp. TaxID=1871066 RepID=UPI000FE9959C|nr:hypothetical protein [Mesorhizobium sp.]RWH74051.1 MAG: hypothetical protein EOQ86_32445 [Mesorhizobium sp.]RWH84187.1 MAG: hypothetical protein EOQ85_00950 [Mesorhizobium sp.]RWH90129.1 MAG: hypothetical protein EOQ88_34130 [Mesorhizobium sp.]RWH93906.1 MAG: hypothetical protein EOQ87_05255 [Mesorhizobium sp.]RWI05150.1 MAG: hypothetical protein EOQ89_03925 [Mesorhizobium sp.]